MKLLSALSSTSLMLVVSLIPTPTCSGLGLLQSDSPIRITAVALASAYDKDEAAADKEYKGQVLAIIGVISSISFKEDSNGNRYMFISLHSLKEPPKDIPYVGDVTCVFKYLRTSSMAKLKKGQKVIIKRTCKGIVLISVFLEDCTLVNPSKSLARYLQPSTAI